MKLESWIEILIGVFLWILKIVGAFIGFRCLFDLAVLFDFVNTSSHTVSVARDIFTSATEPLLVPLRLVLPNSGLIPMSSGSRYLDWSPLAASAVVFGLEQVLGLVGRALSKGDGESEVDEVE